MATPRHSIVFDTRPVGASGSIALGDVVIPDETSGAWVVATTSARNGRPSEAVAISTWGGSGLGKVELQQTGVIDASISGLDPSGSLQLVRVSSAGRLERVSGYTAGDDIVGYASADGRVHLHFGLPWAIIATYAGLLPFVTPQQHGAIGNGTNEDTVAFSGALSAITSAGGGVLLVPSGTYKLGPISIGANTTVLFAPGATVVPVLDTGTAQKLFTIAGDDAGIEGLTITSYAATNTQAKYLIYAIGRARVFVRRCRFANITAGDGHTGSSNLVVTHAIYIENSSSVVIEDNAVDTLSGAAVFLKNISGFSVLRNRIAETGWYSITCDWGCYDGDIAGNRISGDSLTARYWGGSINLMSQTQGGGLGNPNARIHVHHNEIEGVHNYGAAIRALSLLDSTIESNVVHDVVAGSLAASTAVYSIGVDRRGGPLGTNDGNGPCRNLVIANNVLRAGTGGHVAISVNNQFQTTGRDPHLNIQILGNVAESPSTSAYYYQGVTVHGHQAGMNGCLIQGNQLNVYSVGATVPGAIGTASTNVNGKILGLEVIGNRVREISATFPLGTETAKMGIYIEAYCGPLRCQGNFIENFCYGLRTAATLEDIDGGYDNTFINCATEMLLGSPITKGPLDSSQGTALPTTGVFRLGHRRVNSAAAAAASPGWQCTTAGAAHTTLYANGSTYTAGTWYRNTAGRVYELVTAGGGTTSVEPTHTTLGQEVTAADGYTWRCRSTTSVRWATEAVLGAAVALP